MAEENQITIPSGMGGIQRYNEQSGSKFQIKPEYILILITVVILGMAGIKIYFPIY